MSVTKLFPLCRLPPPHQPSSLGRVKGPARCTQPIKAGAPCISTRALSPAISVIPAVPLRGDEWTEDGEGEGMAGLLIGCVVVFIQLGKGWDAVKWCEDHSNSTK